MKNETCAVRYCPKCKVKLTQTHCREESNYLIRTRKCPKCREYSIHTVEVKKDDYNNNVEVLNKIIGLLAELGRSQNTP
jgi:hypothetical protein